MTKKQYDPSFKLAAIHYHTEHPDLTIQACCRNLEISSSTYYKWLKEGAGETESSFRGSGNFSSDEAKEIAHLKRELKNKSDALEILKKAISIL